MLVLEKLFSLYVFLSTGPDKSIQNPKNVFSLRQANSHVKPRIVKYL